MLTEFQLGQVKQAYKLTKCIAKTARLVKVSRGAVSRAIERRFKRAESKHAVPQRIKKRRAALLKITQCVCHKQHRAWPKYSTSTQIRSALFERTGECLSARQVQRELNAIGLKAYTRPHHATRDRKEVRKKIEFARKHRNTDWKRIVFTDESWLSCIERTGKVHWTTSRCKVLPLEKKARWNVASIMVWAAVGFNFKSELVIFPSKTTVEGEARQFRLDAASYVRRCLSTVSAKLVREGRLFQQDGARSHASKVTRAYLARKKVQLLEPWPPYSPELNAIERIWKELNVRVGARCPMGADELVAVVKQEWEALPQAVINAHCEHFKHQVNELL